MGVKPGLNIAPRGRRCRVPPSDHGGDYMSERLKSIFVNTRFIWVPIRGSRCMVQVQSSNTLFVPWLWRGAMTRSLAHVVAVVEDDPSVLDALSNLLSSAGYIVAAFESAETYLAGCAVEECACLISDIGLPGIKGIELQLAVGLREPDLPVILITGRDDYRFRRVDEFHNRGLLHKPFDAERLLSSLADAIKRSGAP